jgi:hypothetical protein
MNFNNFISINALDKALSNGENRSSVSCSYQELFKKYLPAFSLESLLAHKLLLNRILLCSLIYIRLKNFSEQLLTLSHDGGNYIVRRKATES